MPAGDVFGLDGIFLNKSNPVTVSSIGINTTSSGAGIAVTFASFDSVSGIATLIFSTAAGLSTLTSPFYTGAQIAVSGLADASGIAHTGYNGTFIVTGFAGTTTVSYASTGYVGDVASSITGQSGLVMLVTNAAVTNTTWSSAQTHGWTAGGTVGVPALVSTVNRVDFSNDSVTASVRGSLSVARQKLAATGNSNYGWFAAGWHPATPQLNYSRVDRIDFSNDSATASVRGPLSAIRYSLAATGNSNYGWFGGGALFDPTTPGNSRKSTVDRINFSNDSATASLRGPLSSIRADPAATGNSNYGWFGGGKNPSTPAIFSTVDRIDFSNDATILAVRGPLSAIRYGLAATGNSNYGWFGGGYAPAANRSTVDRIDFSNDLATASVRGSLSAARSYLSAASNSNYGWFGGGFSPALRSTVDRINFSNDLATASVRGDLSAASHSHAATSGQARSLSTSLQKISNYGWFGGGSAGPSATLTTRVTRIDFSNDSPTSLVRGPLISARYILAATGNSNYGWFGGGVDVVPNPDTIYSIINRINFSNDISIALTRGPLSSARYGLAATGNSNYGWFGGGNGPVSRVDRIDFSNDATILAVRGPLSLGQVKFSATGNSNYGWFGGSVTAVDRINFSNDLATALPRGPLISVRFGTAATGNSNYGWFGAGNGFPTDVSRVERIDFSNDSPTVSVRGPLGVARGFISATGNSNYGWFGGGNNNTGTVFSRVDRIDFSNDLATASPRGPLWLNNDNASATSNTPTG